MKQVPNTMGQLRKMLSETFHEVRYGHMQPQQGIAAAKIAAQIANLITVEIEACRFLAELGQNSQAWGELPLNRTPKAIGMKADDEDAA